MDNEVKKHHKSLFIRETQRLLDPFSDDDQQNASQDGCRRRTRLSRQPAPSLEVEGQAAPSPTNSNDTNTEIQPAAAGTSKHSPQHIIRLTTPPASVQKPKVNSSPLLATTNSKAKAQKRPREASAVGRSGADTKAYARQKHKKPLPEPQSVVVREQKVEPSVEIMAMEAVARAEASNAYNKSLIKSMGKLKDPSLQKEVAQMLEANHAEDPLMSGSEEEEE